MLAKEFDGNIEVAVKDPALSFELKWDGTRCVMFVEGGKVVKLLGRGVLKNGRQRVYNHQFPDVMRLTFGNHSLILDGEIVCLDEMGVNSFNRVQHRMTREDGVEQAAKEYPATYIPFDLIKYDGVDISGESLSNRREIALTVGVKLAWTATTERGKRDMLTLVKGEPKLEGVMIKRVDSEYTEGRSADWLKWKKTITIDLFCEGETKPGKGKVARLGTFGHLVCYAYRDGVKVEVAHVGGGFTDEMRVQIQHEILDKGKTPFCLEVESFGWAKDKLRHPQFIRLRPDKSPSDCKLE